MPNAKDAEGRVEETDEMGSSCELSQMLPRVVIVSRRTVRKNKFVDFVGEYHLDLIVAYGAVPVIVPRVAGIHTLLQSFEPIHGVLLCEGEDVNPALYGASATDLLSPEEADEVRRLHSSDAAFDHEKDSIELRLARFCLERSIPFLGICRGSQVLNVACGGTLYQDIEKEVTAKCKPENATVHIDYGTYDGHRHPVRVVEGTPLNDWFRESLEEGRMEMLVNSYHHQGVRRMADRFVPMAFARDGLIEGFYDPNLYNPEEGKFLMGLQFHPERMRRPGTEEFDYPGCPAAYREFVKAVIAYQKKVNSAVHVADGQKLDKEMENNRKKLVRSFSLAKHIYVSRNAMTPAKERDLEVGAKFLESNAALSPQQQKRLNQMGATVRNATSYLERLKLNEERKTAARIMMEKMPAEQLTELLSFYLMMGNICSEVLDKKLKAT